MDWRTEDEGVQEEQARLVVDPEWICILRLGPWRRVWLVYWRRRWHGRRRGRGGGRKRLGLRWRRWEKGDLRVSEVVVLEDEILFARTMVRTVNAQFEPIQSQSQAEHVERRVLLGRSGRGWCHIGRRLEMVVTSKPVVDVGQQVGRWNDGRKTGDGRGRRGARESVRDEIWAPHCRRGREETIRVVAEGRERGRGAKHACHGRCLRGLMRVEEECRRIEFKPGERGKRGIKMGAAGKKLECLFDCACATGDGLWCGADGGFILMQIENLVEEGAIGRGDGLGERVQMRDEAGQGRFGVCRLEVAGGRWERKLGGELPAFRVVKEFKASVLFVFIDLGLDLVSLFRGFSGRRRGHLSGLGVASCRRACASTGAEFPLESELVFCKLVLVPAPVWSASSPS